MYVMKTHIVQTRDYFYGKIYEKVNDTITFDKEYETPEAFLEGLDQCGVNDALGEGTNEQEPSNGIECSNSSDEGGHQEPQGTVDEAGTGTGECMPSS